ncbi:MAG: Ldh family oxidoreductase [Caldilineaceae bacterium]
MPTLAYEPLNKISTEILHAAGLPRDQAEVAAHHLVEANLVGHDSHGVIRIPQYVPRLVSGELRPVGGQKIVRERPASVVMDANGSFGIVLAYDAMQRAVEMAMENTFGAVAVHNSGHIGRLGAYPPLAAEKDCIGVVLLNGGAQFVAPYGGVARRLPPNPLAISVPTATGVMPMLDMTTSVAAGGKVDVYRARGLPLPDGWLVDAAGNTVNDANRFREGDVAMMPMGGAVGYKGYGLAFMIDAIAGGLSWAGCSAESPTRGGSGYLALAIKIDSFIDVDDFKSEIQTMVEWLKSSPTMPGFDEVLIPGEVEERTKQRRLAEGIPVEQATWDAIVKAGAGVGVEVPPD